ncbi:hypothetical protein BurJ1DRAFT_3051 [Burkholderiales bacterium JOSHI_001]|nr:hypothetical protein BurJ1DRAFT_3051 [Burkholderiales bacterium JOSHI_001]
MNSPARSGDDAAPIYETVITTCSAAGVVHVAPMGLRYLGNEVLIQPFRPSTTLDNILATGKAVLNTLTDVRVFAGCVTGRQRQWPTVAAGAGWWRLANALGHETLALARQDKDPQRPRLWLARGKAEQHAPFPGMNRAQAAVLEGAVLVSRLPMLPADKVDAEMHYLQIAIDKTAADPEREAWAWLQEAVLAHRTKPQ